MKSEFKSKKYFKNSQSGFVALVSTLVLTVVLSIVMFSNSTSSFFARFDALGSEFKRVSLGLSESCVNQALLKIAQNYNYNPGNDGEVIKIEEDKYECIIDSVEYSLVPGETGMNKKKLATIKTKAQFPIGTGSWSTNKVVAKIQNPEFSVTVQAPTCSFGDLPAEINGGQKLTLTWVAGGGAATEFYIKRTTSSEPTDTDPYWYETTSQFSSLPPPNDLTDIPSESVTYTAIITGPGGTTECLGSPQQVTVIPAPSCADTLVMLDRTGSMSSADLANERAAAKKLLDLYKAIIPNTPQMAIGRFGISNSNANAEVQSRGRLKSTYGDDDAGNDSDNDLYDAVEEATTPGNTATNLSSAISVGDQELNSVRHITDKEKVLILISDGETNQPSPDPDQAAVNAANLAKAPHGIDNLPTEIFTIHFGNEGIGNANQHFLASLSSEDSFYDAGTTGDTGFKQPTNNSNDTSCASNPCWSSAFSAYVDGGTNASDNQGDRHRYYNFGFSFPSATDGIGIKGIEVLADAWSTKTSNSGLKVPGLIHTPNDWDVNTVASVQTSNNSYATENDGSQQGYSNFSLGIPAGATINGIEIVTEARSSDSSGCQIGVNLSWNNGASFGTPQTFNLTGTDSTHTFGSSSSQWPGHNWVASDFSNANFVVRVQDVDPGTNCTNSATTFLDLLQVKISYAESGSTGACELGTQLSWNSGNNWTTEKKQAIGELEETYTFGGDEDSWGRIWQTGDLDNFSFRLRVRDADPDVGSNALCNDNATTHLDYIRAKVHYVILDPKEENKDGDHFFISPTSDDMPVVFEQVGELACPALAPPDSDEDIDPPPLPPPPPPPIDITSWDEVIEL